MKSTLCVFLFKKKNCWLPTNNASVELIPYAHHNFFVYAFISFIEYTYQQILSVVDLNVPQQTGHLCAVHKMKKILFPSFSIQSKRAVYFI